MEEDPPGGRGVAGVNKMDTSPKRPAETEEGRQAPTHQGSMRDVTAALGAKMKRVRSRETLVVATGQGGSSSMALCVSPVQIGVAPPPGSPERGGGQRVVMLVKGPVMRIEMTYNAATGEHRCLVFQSDRNVAIAKLIWTMEDDGEQAHVKNVFVHQSVRGTRTITLEAEEDVRRHNRLVRFYESMGFRVPDNAKVLYLNNYDETFRKVPMYREINCGLQCPELEETDSFMVVILRSPGGSTICGDEGGELGVTYCNRTGVVGGAGAGGSGKGAAAGGGGNNSNNNKGEVERIWVLVQDSAGGVAMLEHQVGRFLCAEPDGKVVANRSVLSTWEVFELESYEDQTDSARELFAFKTFHGKYLRFQTPTSPKSSGASGQQQQQLQEGDSPATRTGGRPVMISTSNEPTLWEVHSNANTGGKGPKIIEVVPDQQGRRKKPSRYPKQATVRAIHRKMRRINSVRFVQSMRSSYCRFQMDRGMTILQAMELLREHQDPLLPDLSDMGLSYADVLMAIAESIRAKGHPDWMQLLGILHGLGRVVFVLLHRKNYELYEDWCFGGQSWVVGCQIPVTIRYPDSNELNDDFEDPLFSTPNGMYTPLCGLDSVLLNWSGAEYMYHFLQHNGGSSSFPREALAMVRYVDLDLWHTGHQYDHLCNDVDHEMRDWVSQFAKLRSQAISDLALRGGQGAKWEGTGDDMGRQQWGYYQALVDKYLPQELAW